MASRRSYAKATANHGPEVRQMLCLSPATRAVLGTTLSIGSFPLGTTPRRRGRAQLRSSQAISKDNEYKGVAMRYRGIEYSVVQGIERRLWKWAATVAGTKISGQGSTRDEAIERAKKAIARATRKQRFKQVIDGED